MNSMTIPEGQLAIGLPVYNGERFLDEVIESIRAQTYADFQLIILDNASTDRTVAICQQHAAQDPRIVVHRNATNIGAAGNFNRVFELAQPCRFFKWAAADDLLEPRYLEACLGLLASDPGVVVAHSEVAVIDEHGHRRAPPHSLLVETHAPDPVRRFRALISLKHWCYDVFGVIRVEALRATPLIAPYIASDRNLLVDLGLLGRFAHAPEPLFLSREHDGRSIRSSSLQDRGAWFDPRLRGRLVLPHFRQFWEYLRTLWRHPIRAGARLRCTVALLSWLRHCRRFLYRDLRHASATLLQRMSPARVK